MMNGSRLSPRVGRGNTPIDRVEIPAQKNPSSSFCSEMLPLNISEEFVTVGTWWRMTANANLIARPFPTFHRARYQLSILEKSLSSILIIANPVLTVVFPSALLLLHSSIERKRRISIFRPHLSVSDWMHSVRGRRMQASRWSIGVIYPSN